MIRMFFAAIFLLFAHAASAGPQYLDDTGYAVSGYDVVAYFDLAQNPVGTRNPEAVPGHAAYTSIYNEAVFAFSSPENLAKFEANPAAYAPQFDGHCAYAASYGGKAPGNPHAWRIIDGKLYLNFSFAVQERWDTDIPGHIARGTENWKSLGQEPASTRAIADFTSQAPLR